jgi:hypothetical protein
MISTSNRYRSKLLENGKGTDSGSEKKGAGGGSSEKKGSANGSEKKRSSGGSEKQHTSVGSEKDRSDGEFSNHLDDSVSVESFYSYYIL